MYDIDDIDDIEIEILGDKIKVVEEWDSSDDLHRSCPFASGWVILIPMDIHCLIMALDKEIDDEFLVYLKGDIDKDKKTIRVTDIYVPEQEVTYSSVDVKEAEVAHKYEGVLHKHPSGVSSFSATDDKYINVNHKFSILLESGKYVSAIVIAEVPCGCKLVANATVKVESKDVEDFLEGAKKKIKKKIYSQSYSVMYPWYRERSIP